MQVQCRFCLTLVNTDVCGGGGGVLHQTSAQCVLDNIAKRTKETFHSGIRRTEGRFGKQRFRGAIDSLGGDGTTQ